MNSLALRDLLVLESVILPYPRTRMMTQMVFLTKTPMETTLLQATTMTLLALKLMKALLAHPVLKVITANIQGKLNQKTLFWQVIMLTLTLQEPQFLTLTNVLKQLIAKRGLTHLCLARTARWPQTLVLLPTTTVSPVPVVSSATSTT